MIKLISNPIFAPVAVIVVIGIAFLLTSKISFVDMVADRVIEKMEAKYSPYGPPTPHQLKKAKE